MATFVRKTFITLILSLVAVLLINYSWQKRKVVNKNFSFNTQESRSLRYFPRAMYAYGLQAWFESNPLAAARFFRQTVHDNPFHIDGWLKLAQAEAAVGHEERSRSILEFTYNLTKPVFRWKWKQMLLARELRLEDVFLQIADYFLARGRITNNIFQLIDAHYNGAVTKIAGAFRKEHLVPYLEWLMRWDRAEDAHFVWQKIVSAQRVDEEIILKYVHFLINKKHIIEANKIWGKFTGIKGMTNGDFEVDITRRGFGWRYRGNRNWEIKRVKLPDSTGSFALQVAFYGKKNISFHHLYQIVPVEPLRHYLMKYRWKSTGITTDQRPFVEIYGYDIKGLYKKGQMITGTNDWRQGTVEFMSPENCHAVVIRLRRLTSKRFDCNIEGTIYLDNFSLNILNEQS
ncbi:MAG: hypothetical protein U9R17_08325 [Thermodesulfobacteriota bacterium]|nr:hypothetical protein [Thermodesulfobacteriota bacterium]